jgi:hypothetical protein
MTIMLDGELTAEEMDAIFGMTEEKATIKKKVRPEKKEVDKDADEIIKVAKKYGEKRAEEVRQTKEVEDFVDSLNLDDPFQMAVYNAKWSELGL